MALATQNQIIAFTAAPFAAAAELPARLLICPWGTTDTGKGTIICNATTVGLLAANQAATKRERIALDFQHNSVEGSKTYTGEPLKVAAYGSLEIVENEGIYLSALEWTPEGKEHAANGHYPDISPALRVNDEREVIWIHSAGLVRQGEIDGLVLFDASDTICAVLNMGLQTGLMSWTGTRELINIFLATVGVQIPESATFDEMKEIAQAGAAKIEACMATAEAKAAVNALDNPPDNPVETMSATTELPPAIEARLAKMEKQAIETKAIAQGKVIPLNAAEIDALDVKTFAALCDRLEAGKVRMTSQGDGKAPADVDTFAANTELDDVLKRMNISKEDFAKYGPKA
mgnify:FL=1